MYTSIIAPLLFASFAIAQSTFLTTSPFVDVYCAYEGSGCGAANRESGTLGFFVITEYADAAGVVTSSDIPSCPVITSTRDYVAYAPQDVTKSLPIISGCPGPTSFPAVSSATQPPKQTKVSTSALSKTTMIPTGRLSVTPMPTVSMSMFHNAAVTPGPQVVLAAAGAVGVVAAMM